MKTFRIYTIAFALLTGCAPEVSNWTPAESPKENQVDRAVFAHTIVYPAHADALGDREKKKFYQFLKDVIQSPLAVNVTIEEFGGRSEKRVKDIERELLRYGIPHDLIVIDYDGMEEPYAYKGAHKKGRASVGSGVKVIIERFVVIPPSCSNFSQQIGDAQQAYAHSNYGCATEANLGMMVANPRDLLRGRERAPYNGAVMAAGVNRYRRDDIKPILQVSTTTPVQPTQQPGGGGGTGEGAPSGGTGAN